MSGRFECNDDDRHVNMYLYEELKRKVMTNVADDTEIYEFNRLKQLLIAQGRAQDA